MFDISFGARLGPVLERLSNGMADGFGDCNHTALQRFLATRTHLQIMYSTVQDRSQHSELQQVVPFYLLGIPGRAGCCMDT